MSALQRAQINEVPIYQSPPQSHSLSFSSLQLPPRVHNRKNGVLTFPNPAQTTPYLSAPQKLFKLL